ncbi:MAG: M24 family metallopeptidase [Dictyoglomaceae bacterium]
MVLEEFKEKERRLREFMKEKGLSGIVLTRRSNFSWLTCGGDNHVVFSTEEGIASLVVTEKENYILTTNIEIQRILDEEVSGLDFKPLSYPWYENKKEEILREIFGDKPFGTDIPLGNGILIDRDLVKIRSSLTSWEIERYRKIGKDAGEVLEEVARNIKPGFSEKAIATLLIENFWKKDLEPTVILVACDDRIYKYRHPIPTDNIFKKQAMLVIMARRKGLQVAGTRLVHVGPLGEELKKKHRAVVEIDANLIYATRPGVAYKELFNKMKELYNKVGYPNEWEKHHQGGPTGYWTREFINNPYVDDVVLENQPVAWNPSITGTKSEDTILVTSNGFEIVTHTGKWNYIKVKVEGKEIERPDILIL